MRSDVAARGSLASRRNRPDRRGRPAVAVLALAIWSLVVLGGSQQACWTAEPPPSIATKAPEKKPEEASSARNSTLRPAAPMSAEEIYAHASPAVVTLKVYGDSRKVTFSGSGFILVDRFAKPFQVDADAKRFAAHLIDAADVEEFQEGLLATLAPKSYCLARTLPKSISSMKLASERGIGIGLISNKSSS